MVFEIIKAVCFIALGFITAKVIEETKKVEENKLNKTMTEDIEISKGAFERGEALSDEEKEKIEENAEVIDLESKDFIGQITQKRDEVGESLISEESRGIYNGLELALSILEGRPPVYKQEKIS